MRRLILGVALVSLWGCVWLTSGDAQAQTEIPPEDLNIYGGGAKASAMGGAFIGVADDAAAAFWNPAGLTQNDRVYTGLQFRYQRQRVQNRLDSPEPLSFLYDNSSRVSIWNVNFASFNAPITIKGQRFYLGASWLRAQDTRFEAAYSLDDFSDVGDLSGDPNARVVGVESFALAEGGTKVVTLAAATQFKEEVFSAGFGLNIYVGSGYDSVNSSFEVDIPSPGFTGFQVIDQTDQRDYIGVNFGFGAMYQWDKYSFGLTVKTPFTLETEHDTRFAQTFFEQTPDSLLADDPVSLLWRTTTKIDIPMQVGLGVAFRPQDNLLFAVDYEYKGFGSSLTFRQADSLDPRSDFVESDPDWDDVHQVRFGMEYMVSTSWGNIPVRAGFRTEPLPFRHLTNIVDSTTYLFGFSPAARLGFEAGDQQFGEVYTLGTGIHWSQIRLDLTYEFHSSEAFNDGYFIDNLLKPQYIYSQNNRRQRLSLGFTGFF